MKQPKQKIKKLFKLSSLLLSGSLLLACSEQGPVQPEQKAGGGSTVQVAETGTQPLSSIKAKDLAPYQERGIEDEVFYFVLPDRFQNGDTSNDLGAKADDELRSLSRGGLDKSHKGMYHGGDLAGLTEKLAYLDEMGITAIWLTPILRNQAVNAGTAGYHGYWILDFTEVDPHLGTNAELKHFIDQAHQRNIKVFFDIITNHTADIIKYTECHGEDGLGWFGDENGCKFKSLAQVASGDKYQTVIPAGTEKVKTPDWLNNPDYYHNQGDSFWQGESSLNGDFAGLDDVKTEDPVVVDGMIEIYKDIISEFKPDGFRIDTVKHVNLAFWQAFSPALLEHAKSLGIDNFFMFGEVYSADPELLSQFTTTGKLQSVLDFGLQSALYQALIEQKGTDTLATLFEQDHFYKDTDSDANQLLSFTGNHDMGRFAHALNKSQHDYGEQEKIQRTLLANALIYFSRGVPVIYYGDEQGFVGDGGDQDARQDMMPSEVASYNDDDLLATDSTTAADNFDRQHPFYQKFAEFARVYQTYPALRYGKQETIFSQQSPGVFAFSRHHQDTQPLTIIVNTATTPQSIELEKKLTATSPLYHLGDKAQVTANEKGHSVSMPPLSLAIYQ